MLSRGRDHDPKDDAPVEGGSSSWDELVSSLNAWNETWVETLARMSPRVVTDLLEVTGTWTHEYFASLDPFAFGDSVSWAATGAAPNWLGIAREYTERWTHQQQIRGALGKPELMEKRFVHPLLATFIRALPRTYREIEVPEGTAVEVEVSGEAGGTWYVVRESEEWVLHEGAAKAPAARAKISQENAWKLFTKALSSEAARDAVTTEGDEALGPQLVRAVAIIA